jgi:RecB family endonuclease NucS
VPADYRRRVTDSPRTHEQPDPQTALAAVERGTERAAMVTVFGRCTVEYEGRAASSLGPGDRLVVLKPDGTVLVHTDEGHQPVNWQPPGCTREGRITDGDLILESERSNPAEQLLVRFERVDHLVVYDPTESSELDLTGSEADLKERILAEPELIEAGFEPRATERETPAGAVDIFGEDVDGTAVVVELKRRRVGPDAVGQLTRYVDALERDLHAGRAVRGVLVAPSVTDRARRLLAQRGLEFVSLEPTEE